MKVVYSEDGDLMACLRPGNAAGQMRDHLVWTTDRIPVDIYEFHCATPDLCYFHSKTGEVIGRRMLPEIQGYLKENAYVVSQVGKAARLHYHLANGIELLRREGVDPLDLRIEVMHEQGIKLVAEIRMGDTHQRSLDPEDPLVPQFAIDHGLNVPYMEELDILVEL